MEQRQSGAQRVANRATFIALGLLLLFFLIAAAGDWEGMIGLALGLLLYFIALAHVPLGLVALIAAFRTGRLLPNLWVYGYFGAFALAAVLFVGGMNEWGTALEETVEGVTDPASVALRDALGIAKTDVGAAERAIADGADVNTRDRSGRTPLMLAANAGQLALVESLLERGADVGAETRYGDTALHYAAGGGGYRHTNPALIAVNVELVRLLVEAGAPLDVVGYKEWTPLLAACASGSVEAYELIRDAGGDMRAHANEDKSCIDIAAVHAQADFVGYLLKGEVAPAEAGNALIVAVYRGHADVFAALIEGGADPAGLVDAGGSLVKRLVDPTRTHRTEINAAMYQTLLVSGQGHKAFPDNGNKALRWSLGREVQALDKLLMLGLDANARSTSGTTMLHDMAGRVEGQRLWPHFQRLLDAGAEIDALTTQGYTPLMFAARKGNLEVSQWLIDAGADVNHANEIGRSALTEAAAAGFGYIIDALAEAGVEVPPRDRHGDLLVRARKHGPAVAALLRLGLDPNSPDDRGVLPLFDIINYGDPEAVEALIDAGADLSQHDGSRQSPLTAAAALDRDAAIAVLIRAGADPNAADARRRRPLEIAIKKGAILSTIELLRGGAVPTLEQRARIEERMLEPKRHRRGNDQLEVLRALL